MSAEAIGQGFPYREADPVLNNISGKGSQMETAPATSKEGQLTSLFHVFLDNGVITPEPSRNPLGGKMRPFSIDVAKAQEILPQLTRVNSFDTPPSPTDNLYAKEKPHPGLLLAQAQRLLPQAEIGLIVADVLPLALHQQVERIVTPEDIRVTTNDFHRFFYGGTTFPEQGEQRGVLEVGQPYQSYLARLLKHTARISRIPLTVQAANDAALIWGVGHEYGHAVNDALQLIQADKRAKENPGLHPSSILFTVGDDMHGIVHREIAPDKELIQAVGDDVKPDSYYTSIYSMTSERIASGFELLSLRHALRSEGLSSSEIDTLLTEYGKMDQATFQGSVASLNYVRSKGMSIDTMGYALDELKNALREKGHTDFSFFPSVFLFKDLGYAKPLSAAQLQSYVGQFGPK